MRTALDTSWKIAHSVLTTSDPLLKSKIKLYPKCACGKLETTIHLLQECVDYNIVIQWFSRLHSNYLTTRFSLQPRHVLFGFGPREKYPPVFSVLLCITKHQFWVSHNIQVCFQSHACGCREMPFQIRSSFRFHLRMQQSCRGTNAFYIEWLGSGIFGVISAQLFSQTT